ncbi:hypothetical protein L2Z53_03740 [Macrococcoides canis]|nr:hypothetical protein [Macrococcus canis]UJS28469.1 hypothetical protein L2Z53_03740 [Macrococcus canis]
MNDKQLKVYHEELEKASHKIAVQRGVILGLITFDRKNAENHQRQESGY